LTRPATASVRTRARARVDSGPPYWYQAAIAHSAASSCPRIAHAATVSDDTSLRLWRRRVSRPAPDGDAMQTDDTPASAGRSGWACSATVPHAHGRAIYSVAWSAHGVLATGAGDNAIGLFHAPPPAAVDGADTDPVVPLALVAQAHAADVNCVRWNPADPDVLASCGDDRVIKIWRLVRA